MTQRVFKFEKSYPKKSEDDVKTEKILMAEMRDNPDRKERERPGKRERTAVARAGKHEAVFFALS